MCTLTSSWPPVSVCQLNCGQPHSSDNCLAEVLLPARCACSIPFYSGRTRQSSRSLLLQLQRLTRRVVWRLLRRSLKSSVGWDYGRWKCPRSEWTRFPHSAYRERFTDNRYERSVQPRRLSAWPESVRRRTISVGLPLPPPERWSSSR